MFFLFERKTILDLIEPASGWFHHNKPNHRRKFDGDQPEQVIQAVTKRISSPDLGGHAFTTVESTGHLKISPQKQDHVVKICYFFVVCEFFFHLRMPPDPKQKKTNHGFLHQFFSCFSPKSFGTDSKNASFLDHKFESLRPSIWSFCAPHVPWCPMLF